MDKRLLILYGSQTGTAEDYAEQIWREARRRSIENAMYPMDSYDIRKLPEERFVVFICSTTGQGEEPENMKQFWKFLLRKSLASDSLNNLQFTVLGLGDSSYQKFNFAAKKLFRRLSQLGAHPLIDMGLADDQHDLGADGTAEGWIRTFWDKLSVQLLGSGKIQDGLLPPKFRISWMEEETVSEEPIDAPYFGRVLWNERVTAEDHFQDTRLLTLDCSLAYRPGDVAVVMPRNLDETVANFIEVMGLDRDLERKFTLTPTESCIALPPSWHLGRNPSLRECIEKFWDLQCVPRRSFFKLLAEFACGLEQERLLEFGTDQEELFSYCNRPRKNVVEVLEDFKDTARRVPLEYLFDLLTPIKPRSFSIASFKEKDELQILVAVVEYKTRMLKPRLGLCSNWLKRLAAGDIIPIWIKKGTFKFPETPGKLLMIGPGTGIAAFRSYAHCLSSKSRKSTAVVVFGCRNRGKDFYFESEWADLEAKGIILLLAAFSRDQERKIYVQHLIEGHSKVIWSAIEDDGMVFVAGSANQMPKSVREALANVAIKEGKMSPEEAEEFLKAKERKGLYQLETWS